MKKFRKISLVSESPYMEENHSKSETTPSQSLSVREILQKHTYGTLEEIQSEPFYSEDLPDLRFMDFGELENWKREAQQDVKDINAEFKRRKAEEAQQEEDSIIENAQIVE